MPDLLMEGRGTFYFCFAIAFDFLLFLKLLIMLLLFVVFLVLLYCYFFVYCSFFLFDSLYGLFYGAIKILFHSGYSSAWSSVILSDAQ
jgi:hypothetical protein